MTATNSITLTENQINASYKTIEDKLTKLGYNDNNTYHFSFMGTRLNIVKGEMTYQALYEFGNDNDFFHLSVDLSESKKLRVKTLKLENQN